MCNIYYLGRYWWQKNRKQITDRELTSHIEKQKWNKTTEIKYLGNEITYSYLMKLSRYLPY
jgi:hypothetical protein